jgi:N-succinyldiaminopimelate aminotransferase
MNPLLSRLQPYPFERLKQLFAGVTPNPEFPAISLGIGEPKHATPAFIKEALSASLGALAAYPATAGDLKLRTSFTDWLRTRYGLRSTRPRRCCRSTARARRCSRWRRPWSTPPCRPRRW